MRTEDICVSQPGRPRPAPDAVWGAVILGVPAVRSGVLAGVMLAVVVLIPLAAHEVFSGLAPAAQEVPRLRSAAARVSAIARPEATTGELRDALREARLLGWVESLPEGLATPVGEHGARLSGGQRQRLALARVLLAGFPVVILDEPAEHLDDATARELTRDLLAATRGRTSLLITHRPVDTVDVDQIVRLGDTHRPTMLPPGIGAVAGPVPAAV